VKRGSKISLRTSVIDTPELNSPTTDFTHFPFQHSYLSNTSKKFDLPTTYRFLLSKPSIAHCEVNSRSTVSHIITFVYILGIYFGNSFALYAFDSDYPNTSLNRHYLTKQSSPDKRGLTVN